MSEQDDRNNSTARTGILSVSVGTVYYTQFRVPDARQTLSFHRYPCNLDCVIAYEQAIKICQAQ
jgi:hypothetical protein